MASPRKVGHEPRHDSRSVTGEGKTLVATLPCYLMPCPAGRRNTLRTHRHGKRLPAKRDAIGTGRSFELLGHELRRDPVAMDSWERHPFTLATWSTAQSEFGFDLPPRQHEDGSGEGRCRRSATSHRGRGDSILIDEPAPASSSPRRRRGTDGTLPDRAKLTDHLKPTPEDGKGPHRDVTPARNFRGAEGGPLRGGREGPHRHVDGGRHPRVAKRFLGIDTFTPASTWTGPHSLTTRQGQGTLQEGSAVRGRARAARASWKSCRDEFTGRMMHGLPLVGRPHQAVEAKEVLRPGEKIEMEAETHTRPPSPSRISSSSTKNWPALTGTALTESASSGKSTKLESSASPPTGQFFVELEEILDGEWWPACWRLGLHFNLSPGEHFLLSTALVQGPTSGRP